MADLQHEWRRMEIDDRIKHVGKYPVLVAAVVLVAITLPLFPLAVMSQGWSGAIDDYAAALRDVWRDVTA